MIRVEVERYIDQPIENIFDRLVDIPSYSNWLPKSRVFLETYKTTKGPVRDVLKEKGEDNICRTR